MGGTDDIATGGGRGAGSDPSVPPPPVPPFPSAPAPPAAPAAPFLPLHWRESGAGESPTATSAAPATSTVPVWGPVDGSGSGVRPAPAPVVPAHRTGPVWLWATVVMASALLGALIGGGLVALSDHGGGTTTVKEISAGPALLNGTTDIESVIDKVLPAVVSIAATSPEPASESLFGSSGGNQEDQGTGMIISSDGEVITNNHVVAGATRITVTLYGSLKALPATVIDTDPTNDVALLQIAGRTDLPTVTFGDSDAIQVGDAVVSIGNALGLSAGTPTVTQGIISAKGRTVQATDSTGAGDSTETLTNMIQTDAAINPGNSGGPLVDSAGMVIGMNTAVASSNDGTAQAQDIGFAIPSNRITQLLPDLRSGSITGGAPGGTGYLGVEIETLTPPLRSAYDFIPLHGAVVLQVESGSPAEAAGLQEGDVIVSLDGKGITSADQLGTAIQADRPGQTVRIVLYRGTAHLTVEATLSSNSPERQLSGG